MERHKQKIIVIVGPTASGKSELAVQLAKKFRGEVISADSRQVYRGLDIGSGKITRKEMRGVRHWLLDVVDPKRRFSVVAFAERASRAIEDIGARGKLPIVAGGTGFWIDALASGIEFPKVAPNPKLRRNLARKSAAELLRLLQRLDSERARTIEEKNPRRLIRAIEIATAIGRVPKVKKRSPYEVLWIGIKLPPRVLKKRIHVRLLKRTRAGMIEEARRLRTRGLPWKRFDELGLECKYLADFLRKKITKEEMLSALERAITDYARRQMVWWKRNKNIHWVKNQREAESLIRNFRDPAQ